jgi:hypothetical protein
MYDVKIISGGQTGVDRMGLEVAHELGLPTGGTAPKGYLTEKGADPSLAAFGLTEHPSRDYTKRTRQIVLDSDATVLYGDPESPGSKTTIEYCLHAGKPYLLNPIPDDLTAFIRDNHIQTLNIADNRGSKLTTDLLDAYRTAFRQALLPFSDANNK